MQENKKIENLSFDDKIKVWLDYIATQYALKYFSPEIKINNHYSPSGGSSIYPNLGIYFPPINHNKKPRKFEEFCLEEDSRVAEGLKGWYWRFKDRIFKTNNHEYQKTQPSSR